jgi:hypothetical protein
MTRIWLMNTDKKVDKIRFNPSNLCDPCAQKVCIC